MPNALQKFACVVLLLMANGIMPLCLHAQQENSRSEPVFRIQEEDSRLSIIEKFSTVVELKTKVRRVDGFDPAVLNVTALSPHRIRVQGVTPGVTTIVLEDEDNRVWSVEVFITGDVRYLQAHIRKLFPKASVEAVEVGDAVVLRGWVTHPEHITELVEVAQQFYPEVLNQIKVGGVQQVQLHVRVMEIQRTKVRRLGMNFLFIGDNGYLASTVGSLTPIQSLSAVAGAGPSIGVSTNSLSDPSITFGLVNSSRVFQGFVEALKQEGLLKIMAQPSITTTNGRPASLLNGGEFPILVPAGLGTVGVEFREFGVRMEAVPIILGGGRLRLELQPEVSERDFANAISVQGVTVPGLTVRRANTQVEMGFGQTLMIAGLISRRHTAETDKLPLFGELPWIGVAFSRKRYEEVETELVILVTPEYVAPLKKSDVPPGGPGASTTVPLDRELFLNQMIEVPNYGEPQFGHIGEMSSSSLGADPVLPNQSSAYERPPMEQRQQLPPPPSVRAVNTVPRPPPTAPLGPAPNTPPRPAPTAPLGPIPNTPPRPAPTAPLGPVQNTPPGPAPTAPLGPAPNTPPGPAPTAPLGTAPKNTLPPTVDPLPGSASNPTPRPVFRAARTFADNPFEVPSRSIRQTRGILPAAHNSTVRDTPGNAGRTPISIEAAPRRPRPNLRLQMPKRAANYRPPANPQTDARRPNGHLRPGLIAPTSITE